MVQVFISGSETTGEFRAQLYTPDYLQSGKPRPVISGAPDTVDYSTRFSFKYSNVTSVDRVVFHRLTGDPAVCPASLAWHACWQQFGSSAGCIWQGLLGACSAAAAAAFLGLICCVMVWQIESELQADCVHPLSMH